MGRTSSRTLVLILDEHRFCLAQRRRCSTEIRYLESVIVWRSPAKYLSFKMPPSLLGNGFGYSWRSYSLQLSQSGWVLEFGMLEEKGPLGSGNYLLRCTHIHSLTLPVNQPQARRLSALPVNQTQARRLPAHQQHIHLRMHPLHSTSSMIHHWQL